MLSSAILFWFDRRVPLLEEGLESAINAHMLAHVVMLAAILFGV
jgi:hypothetical protein